VGIEEVVIDTVFPKKWSKKCRYEISMTNHLRSLDGMKPPPSPKIRPAIVH
jgi:hypothetical protein